ncbi:DUF3152 domain-containing protein [Streptomyces sp. CB01580]|uniref:DUF3152 domain-containing protein n=1 Tax=Streptomyces sp. CB01580 TaxID=1703933 RepID=UPI00093B7FC3|nr:DUF3152 domain-containing protein [Streptomyces sp. CB01580]OKJ43770.1 hypothetical protein AMK22_03945 [Streptomyces sp. CB01580]
MGRHSRTGPERAGPDTDADAALAKATDEGPEGVRPGPGSGRRRRPAGAESHVSFQQAAHVRGGHPEHREPGGGWGAGPGTGRPADGERPVPRRPMGQARTADRAEKAGRAQGAPASARPAGTKSLIPGPRREFVEAFDTPPTPPTPPPPRGEGGPAAGRGAEGSGGGTGQPEEAEEGKEGRGSKGRTFTGIAAAAVTTVLAVVVAGQVAQDDGASNTARSAGVDRDDTRDASRSDDRPTPTAPRVKPLTYEQKMARAYPLAAKLRGPGKFDSVPGTAKAPGTGHKYRYRIDVEQGLGLDPDLFARAVQETLNDDRSWAHDGAMTFERVSSGDPDFVITLASPGTTADWCRKSGLDTTVDNVSCDSAATERVMINAYRWAQGSATFGPDELFAYRQMLINHEVGHRLGHNHVSCRTPGALAPVMQQQTKSLDIDGVKCRPNAWAHPGR